MKDPYSKRARALIGSRFRPQGRDRANGFDCIGLVARVYSVPATEVPRAYRLRGDHFKALLYGLAKWFRRVPRRRTRPGDLLLVKVASDQAHLAIQTDRGIVHADAALRRVVERPGPLPWPIAAGFRRRTRKAR